MELDQWIAVYQAAVHSADGRQRSFWIVFGGGILTAALFVVALGNLEAFALSGVSHGIRQGAAALGLVVGFSWLGAQWRLRREVEHWERLLRSLESQFAGVELHRSLDRIGQGERVCVPDATWVCGEWRAESAYWSPLTRTAVRWCAMLAPVSFLLALISLLIAISSF